MKRKKQTSRENERYFVYLSNLIRTREQKYNGESRLCECILLCSFMKMSRLS